MSETGTAGPLVRLGMAPRAGGLTMAAALEHWRGAHGEVAGAIPGLRRYVQNHHVLVDGRPLLPYPGFDACSELEFDDLAAMRAGFASAHYGGAVGADEALFIDRDRKLLALTTREVLAGDAPPPGAVKLLTLLRAHPSCTPGELAALLRGPHAEAVAAAGALRHELLVTDHAAHAGELPPCADAIDILWFADAREALAAVTGVLSGEAARVLAGHAFGSERMIATPVRQRTAAAGED